MLFEQKKQHLWHSCCPISLVISNMKFNRKLSEQFWRIWCFPIQSDKSCTWMPFQRWPPSDMTCLKETLTLLPGVNSCFHWQLMTKPPETDVTTRCKRGLTNERQLLYSHSSTTHKHDKTDERNSFVMEGTTAGRKRTQWSQGKQTSERDRKERQSARVTDETDVHKPEKTSDQAHFKAVLSLFTWRSRFLDAKDQLILWFVSYILSGKEERHQPKRKKKC